MGLVLSKKDVARTAAPPLSQPVKGPGQRQPTVKAAGDATQRNLAVLQLKEQRDQLNRAARRAAKLSVKLTEEAARWLRSGDAQRKDKALRCLKRKKLHEEQLRRIAAMQENVEATLNQVESASFEAQVLSALKAGGDALRSLVMDMGDVEASMDSIADAVADAQAVSALVSQQLGVPDLDLSDGAMEAELESLVSKDHAAWRAPIRVPDHAIDDGSTMPPVPSHELRSPTPIKERDGVAA